MAATKDEVKVVAGALRAQGKSTLWATRSLMRRFPSLERGEALAALEYVPEAGLWSKANVEWGFGYRSPERTVDPIEGLDYEVGD